MADPAATIASATRFASVLDLARLPYFEARSGRLRLADPALGPAIDVHTHLALAYGRRPRVDLLRASAKTEHYLPARGPIDFEVYMNRNFLPADLARMKRDLTIMSFGAGGMRATHTAPNLEREMADLGIESHEGGKIPEACTGTQEPCEIAS